MLIGSYFLWVYGFEGCKAEYQERLWLWGRGVRVTQIWRESERDGEIGREREREGER